MAYVVPTGPRSTGSAPFSSDGHGCEGQPWTSQTVRGPSGSGFGPMTASRGASGQYSGSAGSSRADNDTLPSLSQGAASRGPGPSPWCSYRHLDTFVQLSTGGGDTP